MEKSRSRNLQPSPERKEESIRINGKQQVIEMLRSADPAFREVILRGIEKRDFRLARELRAAI